MAQWFFMAFASFRDVGNIFEASFSPCCFFPKEQAWETKQSISLCAPTQPLVFGVITFVELSGNCCTFNNFLNNIKSA